VGVTLLRSVSTRKFFSTPGAIFNTSAVYVPNTPDSPKNSTVILPFKVSVLRLVIFPLKPILEASIPVPAPTITAVVICSLPSGEVTGVNSVVVLVVVADVDVDVEVEVRVVVVGVAVGVTVLVITTDWVAVTVTV
jgi:hypothetical protein